MKTLYFKKIKKDTNMKYECRLYCVVQPAVPLNKNN